MSRIIQSLVLLVSLFALCASGHSTYLEATTEPVAVDPVADYTADQYLEAELYSVDGFANNTGQFPYISDDSYTLEESGTALEGSDGNIEEGGYCPSLGFMLQADSDEDLVADACDNCPNDHNPNQEDLNENGIGDACDIEIICADGTPALLDGTCPIAKITPMVCPCSCEIKFSMSTDKAYPDKNCNEDWEIPVTLTAGQNIDCTQLFKGTMCVGQVYIDYSPGTAGCIRRADKGIEQPEVVSCRRPYIVATP